MTGKEALALYFTGITTYIYTVLAPKLTATASVAQSVERWSRDPGSWVQFPAGGLGVAFFVTGPGWVLKMYIFLKLEFTFKKQSSTAGQTFTGSTPSV